MLRKLRCAVVGNSNSITDRGYVHHLVGENEIEVQNFSIGGCPNSLLLQFLAAASDLDFDYIIAETSVIDCALGLQDRFDRAEAESNARIFSKIVKTKSRAEIIFLILPTQQGLMYPKRIWVEDVYTKCASEFGYKIFNGYNLFKILARGAWRGMAQDMIHKAEVMLSDFGWPKSLAPAFLWQPLFLARRGLPPAARHFFHDDWHISYLVHIIIANVLAQWMKKNRESTLVSHSAQTRPILTASPEAGRQNVERCSRLLTRRMAEVTAGTPVRYEAPVNFRAAALLINQSATCGIGWIETQGGVRTEIDLRHEPSSRAFTAIVVPIPKDIGDGPYIVGIRSGEGVNQVGRRYWHVDWKRRDAHAEVADLVLIQRDLDLSSDGRTLCSEEVSIDGLTWVADQVHKLVARLELPVLSAEIESMPVVRRLFEQAVGLISSNRDHPAEIVQARFAIASGDLERAMTFLSAALERLGADPFIEQLMMRVKELATFS